MFGPFLGSHPQKYNIHVMKCLPSQPHSHFLRTGGNSFVDKIILLQGMLPYFYIKANKHFDELNKSLSLFVISLIHSVFSPFIHVTMMN